MQTETYMTTSELKLADGTVIGRTNANRTWFGESQRLGSLPHDWYDLDAEYQDTHEDKMVYIGDEING